MHFILLSLPGILSGYSAQYCSYTLMENDTKKILTVHTRDKRTTDRKSTNMEKAGFQNALNELLEKNINVKEVVTDAHLGIVSVMSEFVKYLNTMQMQ